MGAEDFGGGGRGGEFSVQKEESFCVGGGFQHGPTLFAPTTTAQSRKGGHPRGPENKTRHLESCPFPPFG